MCLRRTAALGSAKFWPRWQGANPSFWEREWGALDVRYVGDSRPGGALADAIFPARARVWIKANGSLPDERRMHQAALAYASDLTLLAVTTVPHGVFVGLNVQAASIDHALVVSPPISRGRLAAVRSGFTVGIRRPRPIHRTALSARSAGGRCRARGTDPAHPPIDSVSDPRRT